MLSLGFCSYVVCVQLCMLRYYYILFESHHLGFTHPEEGGTGGTCPQWKKMGHTICPELMSFLEGWGVGGGVTWSLEKVNTKISKLYSRIVGFNTESVTSLVDIGALIVKSRESKCVYKCAMTFVI